MPKDTQSDNIAYDEIPYSFDKSNSMVKWIRMGNQTFKDPFFHTTIRKCFRDKQEERKTDLEKLLRCRVSDFVPVKVLIFHVSRCGSTLLAQMLAESPRNIVLSEPAIVNELLLSNLPYAIKKEALTKSLKILGRKRTGKEENVIIKLDSWHLLFFDQIREAFPSATILFLFREPESVLQSHQKMRGSQMVPGLLKLQIVTDPVPIYDLDGFAVKVLEQFYSAMNKNRSKADLLLDYRQLPKEGLNLMLEKTGLNVGDEEKKLMLKRAAFDSKDPLIHATINSNLSKRKDFPGITRLQELYSALLDGVG